MSKIKAVIFDIDGTLVDTSEFIFQCYEYALNKHASSHDRKEIAALVGKRLEECYGFLEPDGDQASLIASHREFQGKNLDLIQPFEYVASLLGGLHKKGIRLALFTSRSKHVKESLKTAGVDPTLFDVIVNGADVKHGKPDPEGINLILKKMNLKAAEVAMIGDAAVDILVGKNAGLAITVGITHGFGTREELESVRPDAIIDSLQELPAALGVKS